MSKTWYSIGNYRAASRAINTEAVTHRSKYPMSASNHTTDDKIVYIYGLQRISDGAYLYVGSAKRPDERFVQHSKANRYTTIRAAFNDADIRIVTLFKTSEHNRIDAETKIWNQLKLEGNPIANKNPSDIHLHLGNRGRKHSPESRKNMSEAHKGKRLSKEQIDKISSANKGRKLGPISEERRQKLSAAHKGKPSSMKGKTHTEEAKRKTSESKRGCSNPHTGVPRTLEARQKMSDSRKGKRRGPMSEEQKLKLSIANTGKTASLETRNKMSASHKRRLEENK